jgi:hypothetical protein
VDDEVLARFPALVGVVNTRVDERLLDSVTVDLDRRLVGVLLDDREQVPQQTALGRRQLRALDRRVRGWMIDPVNRRTRGGDPAAVPAVPRPCQALARRFALLRNLRPSSCRCA